VLSDTVLLNSPTTTRRDHDVVAYLEQLVGIDAQAYGREMFEATSDVAGVPASEIVTRDAKEYELPSGDTISIAQIETVGSRVLERAGELRDAIEEVRRRNGYLLAALMVTDILAGDTELIACGDQASIERAFGEPEDDAGTFKLPGVMSRKKQVAPRVLGAI
jgi:manganese-dependent inorganic pyrophosphatase